MMNSILSLFLQASPQGNKFLFQSDKINTVLVVVLIVFAGMIGILVVNLLKVGKLERKIKDLQAKNQGQDINSKKP